MSIDLLLKNYEDAISRRDQHIKENKGVFDEHQNIVFRVMDAENALFDEVAMNKYSKETVVATGEKYKVVYIPQKQEVIDREMIAKMIQPEDYAKVIYEKDRSPKIKVLPL